MEIKLSQAISSSRRASLLALIVLTTFLTSTTGCSNARHRNRERDQELQQGVGVAPPVNPGVAAPPVGPGVAGVTDLGDRQVVDAQARHLEDVEVTFTARVKKLLPPDRKGVTHQRFLLELSNDRTILVAHNTDLAPEVPIQKGDLVTVHGEYIWNARGGVVHYTHHTTNRHQGGWINFNGQTYQ